MWVRGEDGRRGERVERDVGGGREKGGGKKEGGAVEVVKREKRGVGETAVKSKEKRA